jgi:hypothetical protein
VKLRKVKLAPVPKKGRRSAKAIKGISMSDLLRTVGIGNLAVVIAVKIKARKKR